MPDMIVKRDSSNGESTLPYSQVEGNSWAERDQRLIALLIGEARPKQFCLDSFLCHLITVGIGNISKCVSIKIDVEKIVQYQLIPALSAMPQPAPQATKIRSRACAPPQSR